MALQNGAAFAGGFSAEAVPTRVEALSYGGFMIYGSFGNPAECTVSDRVFVVDTHPQFKLIQAMSLLAISTSKPMRLYAHECRPVTWYSVPTVTYNSVTGGAVYLVQ